MRMTSPLLISLSKQEGSIGNPMVRIGAGWRQRIEEYMESPSIEIICNRESDRDQTQRSIASSSSSRAVCLPYTLLL
jgi:hypothetical protein